MSNATSTVDPLESKQGKKRKQNEKKKEQRLPNTINGFLIIHTKAAAATTTRTNFILAIYTRHSTSPSASGRNVVPALLVVSSCDTNMWNQLESIIGKM
jgi:hypothetical protein